jgi:acetoin utilization protein AcuB
MLGMLMPAISQYMTREPYSIPSSSTAGKAKSVMRSHLVRHLAIMDGPEVVGIVSGADLEAMTKLTDLDLETVPVSSVMTTPVTVWGSAPLDEVAEMMSEKKCDCVVVLGGHGLQGIFTATDALRALSELLQRAAG